MKKIIFLIFLCAIMLCSCGDKENILSDKKNNSGLAKDISSISYDSYNFVQTKPVVYTKVDTKKGKTELKIATQVSKWIETVVGWCGKWGNTTEVATYEELENAITNLNVGRIKIKNNIKFNGQGLEILRPIEIFGDSGAGITLDGQNKSKIFNVGANVEVSFENIAFINGKGNSGGAISSHGSLKLVNCKFENNEAVEGGAVYSYRANFKIKNSTFENNHAKDSGGSMYAYEGFIEILNSDFNNNTSVVDGGAIYTYEGYIKIGDSNFKQNVSLEEDGGAIYQYSNKMELTNCKFSNNKAKNYGGAVFTYEGIIFQSALTFDNNKSIDNKAIVGDVREKKTNVDTSKIDSFNLTGFTLKKGPTIVRNNEKILFEGYKENGYQGEGYIFVPNGNKVTIAFKNFELHTNDIPGIYIGDKAEVKLILLGENWILGGSWKSGVEIGEGAKLDITSFDGTDEGGILNVESSWSAAISNACDRKSGQKGGILIINSGTINARGSWAAAIGGSHDKYDNGTVLINGGHVYALSSYGAGIGGASIITEEPGVGNLGHAGEITINGGVVETDTDHGVYIGGRGGNIVINGGIVYGKPQIIGNSSEINKDKIKINGGKVYDKR